VNSIEVRGKPGYDATVIFNFRFTSQEGWTPAPPAVDATVPTDINGSAFSGQDLNNWQAGWIIQKTYRRRVGISDTVNQWQSGLDSFYTQERNTILQKNIDKYGGLIIRLRNESNTWSAG